MLHGCKCFGLLAERRGWPKQRQVGHERRHACVRVLGGCARAWQNLTNGTKYKFTESTGTYISSAIMSELVDKYQFQYKVGILIFKIVMVQTATPCN